MCLFLHRRLLDCLTWMANLLMTNLLMTNLLMANLLMANLLGAKYPINGGPRDTVLRGHLDTLVLDTLVFGLLTLGPRHVDALTVDVWEALVLALRALVCGLSVLLPVLLLVEKVLVSDGLNFLNQLLSGTQRILRVSQ